MSKLIVIGGPTASGKTALAIEIAKKYNGEIINADSRQIYKFLDIGTNKGHIQTTQDYYAFKVDNYRLQNPFTPEPFQIHIPIYTIESVPIYLISFLFPDERFNVFRFKKLAEKMITKIQEKGKLPIIVGGTGLYVDAVIKNYQEDGMSEFYDENYREYLSSLDVPILQNMLKKSNLALFESLNESDKTNPRRLSRLLEKIKALDIKGIDINISTIKDTYQRGKSMFDVEFLYPEFDWDELKSRIELRVDEMFKEGLVDETKKVLDMGFPKASPALQSMGYKEVVMYLDGKVDLNKCIELVKQAHKQYARRQRTWFESERRDYNLQKVSDIAKVTELLKI